MKVQLCQLDGPLMNLALSKLATYHRLKGDIVGRKISDPDLIYYSAIFTKTAEKFRNQHQLGNIKTVFGGYPFNDSLLPPEAEYLMPAYDLWKIDYSLGYSSRGCPRDCPFCIVPQKEGMIRDAQPIWGFHCLDHKKIVLLDNNFFASPKWRDNLAYIHENDLRVSFTQGLDIRVMTEEIAGLLADTRSENLHFTHKQYYFAWDSIKDEESIRSGLDLLLASGIRADLIYLYVLVGFDSTHQEDYRRCEVLWKEFKVHPFVMKYNGAKKDHYLNELARWACRPAGHRNHPAPKPEVLV